LAAVRQTQAHLAVAAAAVLRHQCSALLLLLLLFLQLLLQLPTLLLPHFQARAAAQSTPAP
jgi:hypothetical protein